MSLKELARNLRKNSTDAERKLWQYLRKKQISGFKFRRQVVIEPYIVGFVCFEKKLIVELDGGQHLLMKNEDKLREENLHKRDLVFYGFGMMMSYYELTVLQNKSIII